MKLETLEKANQIGSELKVIERGLSRIEEAHEKRSTLMCPVVVGSHYQTVEFTKEEKTLILEVMRSQLLTRKRRLENELEEL